MNIASGPSAMTLLVAGFFASMALGCGDDDGQAAPSSTGGSAGDGGQGGGVGTGAAATGGQGGFGSGGEGGSTGAAGGVGGFPPSCDGSLVEAFGDFSGALAVDSEGNVFAGATMADGSQTTRGFLAADIAAAPVTTGAEVLALDGFGGPMAALAPDASGQGLLVYQPTDGTSFLPLDPIGVHYDASGAAIVAVDSPAPIITLAVPGTAVSLMADDADRLWVGLPRIGGGTKFIVIERTDAGVCLTPVGVSNYLSVTGSGLCFDEWYDAPDLELTALLFTLVEPTWGLAPSTCFASTCHSAAT